MPRIPIRMRELVVMKKLKGMSLNKIAEQLELNHSSTQNIWQKFKEYGFVEDLPKGQ